MGTKWLVKYVVCRLMRRERKNSCTFCRHTQHNRTYVRPYKCNKHTVTTIVYSQATAVLCALHCTEYAIVLGKSQLSCGSALHTPNADSHWNVCTGVLSWLFTRYEERRSRRKKCKIIWWFIKRTHGCAYLFTLNLFQIALLGIVLHSHVIEICDGPFNALIWTAIIST